MGKLRDSIGKVQNKPVEGVRGACRRGQDGVKISCGRSQRKRTEGTKDECVVPGTDVIDTGLGASDVKKDTKKVSQCPDPKRVSQCPPSKATPKVYCRRAVSGKPTKREIPSKPSGVEGVEYLSLPTKPDNDKKSYRVLRLQNGLRALLISDPPLIELHPEDVSVTEDDEESMSESGSESDSESEDGGADASPESGEETNYGGRTKDDKDKAEEKLAALSLTVGVGSFSDPWEIQGMAHFLEHMVFMGSEKFPKENEFDSYLKKRGGSDNASTDSELTTFFFECQEKYMAETIDRFAQFFISPLMKREAMTREREAIESEFQLAIPSHYNRKQQLVCSLSRKGCPVQKFSWGNHKTLRDNISDEVLHKAVHDFRRRHYSAHRMTLAIQARLPLDTLEEWVCKFFSSVPNNNLPPDDFSAFNDNCFNTPDFRKLYYVDPFKDICQVELTWSLPPMMKHYRSKPDHYVASVLGYEGAGSLLSYLRRKVWALNMYTGNEECGNEDNSMFSLFNITIVLTEDGHKNLPKVLESVFGFINLMKKVGPDERIFNELKFIEEMNFRFSEEVPAADNVEVLSECILHYPPEHIITGPKLFFEYDPKAIIKVLDCIQPETVNVLVATKNPGVNFDLKEQWFGTRYTCKEIPAEWINAWKIKEPEPEFSMPAPNIYITTNFDLLKHPPTSSKYPEKILDDELMEVWYRPDTKFELPIAFVYFYFISPMPISSPQNSVLLDLYVSLLKQQMVEALYPAEEAMLHTATYSVDKGLVIKFDGYNEKLPILIETVMNHIGDFEKKLDERVFDAMKEEQAKYYYNNFMKPKKLVKELRFTLVMHVYWNGIDKYSAVDHITMDMLKQFAREFKKHLFVQCLIQGNISADQSLAICDSVKKHLKYKPLLPYTKPELRVCQLPLGQTYVQVPSFSEEDVNSVVTNFYQSGVGTIKDMCTIELLMLLMEEPVFNILRTKEQLGYNVDNLMRETFGILGFSITVNCQADKHSTEHVDERIENFLKTFFKKLNKMTEKDLDRYKQTAIKLKQCVDLHLREEVCRNWDEITTGDYVFDRLEREIACIQKLTFADLRKWLSNHSQHGDKTNFRKLSLQVAGHVKKQKRESGVSKGSRGTRDSRISRASTISEESEENESSSGSGNGSRSGSGSSGSYEDDREFSLDEAKITKKNGNECVTDIANFKKELFIYPATNITT